MNNQKILYSNNINQFNIKTLKFINYIKEKLESEEICTLFLHRDDTTIHYGYYNEGYKEENDVIEMTSEDDLRKIYELLENEFQDNFDVVYIHTFGEGWSLKPIICEKIIINLESYNQYDRNWFYEETHKEHKKLIKKTR